MLALARRMTVDDFVSVRWSPARALVAGPSRPGPRRAVEPA